MTLSLKKVIFVFTSHVFLGAELKITDRQTKLCIYCTMTLLWHFCQRLRIRVIRATFGLHNVAYTCVISYNIFDFLYSIKVVIPIYVDYITYVLNIME